MASLKKTTGNFIWLFLAAAVVLAAPKLFFDQTELLRITLTAKSAGCEKAEFFAGQVIPKKLPNYIHAVLPTYEPTTNPGVFTASGVLKKPFELLRVDPCTRSGETVEIMELKLSDSQGTTVLNLSELDIECTNCELSISPNQTLIVKTLSSDPQLVLKNLEPKLFDFSNPWLSAYTALAQLALAIIAILSLVFLGFSVFKLKNREIIIFTISNIVAGLVFSLLYKKRFGLSRHLPFGDEIFQTGLAYVHLNSYSRYTDNVLYLVPLIGSVGLLIAGLWYFKKRK